MSNNWMLMGMGVLGWLVQVVQVVALVYIAVQVGRIARR
jgi:hypothetical protein